MATSPRLSRRTLLRTSVGAAVAATTVGAGCASKDSLLARTATRPVPPDFVPFDGPPPDLPPTSTGIPASFYRYPTETVRAVPPPGARREAMRGLVSINWAPPTPRGQNPVWAEVEQRLGREVDLSIVSSPDYGAKLATVISTGDLPDMFQWFGTTPYYLTFFQRECADLTPYLSGAGVRDYPALANLATPSWAASTIGGGIWGIPNPRYATYGNGLYRKDMFDRVGPVPDNAEDWLRYLKELTRPQDNVYGAITSTGKQLNLTTYKTMFGCPLNWRRERDGSLTKDFMTEEYLAAVEFARTVYAAGVYYPGSPGMSTLEMKNQFNSGRAATVWDTISSFPFATGFFAQSRQQDPQSDLRFVPRIAHDGGEGIAYLDGAINGYTVLRKGSEEQVRALLEVANFFASPFGTEEFTLLKYGLAGTDHTRDATGNPVLTTAGQNNINVPFRYLADGPQTIFDSERESVDTMHGALTNLLDRTVADPTQGLYSPTLTSVGTVLDQKVSDTVTAVISGRASPQALVDLRGWWRDRGGGEIQHELEEALAAAGGPASPTPTPRTSGTPSKGPR